MPISSLVEGWVGVVVEVGVWVKMQFSCLTFSSGWLGGWLEKSDIKVISTQLKLELKLKLELSLAKIYMVWWVGGYADDSFRKYCHFVASYKLEHAIFSALPQ